MTWTTFPSDLTAGLLGTFLGLVFGLGIDRKREQRRAESRDERLVQNLIDRLAGKRAFAHSVDVGLVDNADDRQRCVDSVLDARMRILDVCDQIDRREDVVGTLRAMEVDCLALLSHVERHPLEYARALIRLRDRLIGHEAELQLLMPGLHMAIPAAETASVHPGSVA
ncbi:hypothetical protein AB4Z14_03855 [Terrabacter sp. 2TAF16]|uniref:hypothetical protein n=1 Tax=Terrabacter sp. 2TAF16 TaxID=3233008 RepID=UPI003F97F31E